MMGRAAGAAINSGIAGAAINSGLKSRGLPAIAPDRPSSSTSSPDTGSPHKENAGAKAIGSASKYVSSGMNKVTSNSHVSKGLGKVGAGGLASKFTPQSSKPYAGASVGYERTIPPAPGGLSSGRNHPPPPTRRAASDLPQAQAMYDYAGGVRVASAVLIVRIPQICQYRRTSFLRSSPRHQMIVSVAWHG